MVPSWVISAIVVTIAGMALSILLIPVLSRFGHRFELLDHPAGRKQHDSPVPLVGGLTILTAGFVALAVGTFWRHHTGGFSWWFLGAVCLMLLLGVCDDAFGLSYKTKFFLQAIVVLSLIILTQLKVSTLGHILGGGAIHLEYMAIPFTLLCLVGYINAANMIDGLDGLAGGIALISLVFLAAYLILLHLFGWLTDVLAFAGATLGFLAYNLRTPWRHQAAVFLGDGGSLLLGLVVGWFAIRVISQPGAHTVSPASVAWILALPVIDTLVVMGRRLLSGHNPFRADRHHMHHTLIDIGFSHSQATWVLLLLASLYGLYGLMGYVFGLPDWIFFCSFLLMLLLHAAFALFSHRLASSRSMEIESLDSVSR